MDYSVEQEFRKIWQALRCKANCNSGGSYTFENGLTNTSGIVRLGGTLTQNTSILNELGSVSVKWQDGDGFLVPIFGVSTGGIMQSSVKSSVNTLTYSRIGEKDIFTELQLGHANYITGKNSAFQFGSGATTSDAKFILGTNTTLGASGLSYGVESWTDREEVNMYITDNTASHDICRVNLGCDAAITTSYYELYVVDPTTYTGVAAHGVQRIKATETGGIQLNYKEEDGGYTYADQSLRTNVTIKDSFTVNKPAIGNVFSVSKLGQVNISQVATYADDTAAITGGLTSGDVYKTTTLGSTFLKIVP